MRPLKIISIIVLFISIFALFTVPMENNQFPGWINADLIQFMLIMLSVSCVIVLIR
jgi:hypothetical protein